MPRWRWILGQVMRRLWLRASLLGVLGVVAAGLGAVVNRYIPWQLPGDIGVSAVGTILNIMASSMLAVTTFSLSVVTSASGSATNNGSPRASKFVMEDSVTQNALSSFIGSFLFSIVGIIVLQIGGYGDRGRAVLFLVTIGVIALVVISLMRWIAHLTDLGSVGETTTRVEAAARAALADRLAHPYLDGQRLADPTRDVPSHAVPICGETLGYLQHIDMPALSRAAAALDMELYLHVNPGAFLYADSVLAWAASSPSGKAPAEGWQARIADAFLIGPERHFEQDPRFGLVVLSEIASRALSPAVNDPGTAIDVIGRLVRLMSLWASGPDQQTAAHAPKHPRLHVPPIRARDLFEDAFMAIGRDGAALIEVQLRLQKGLAALGRIGDGEFQAAARVVALGALTRAEATLALETERQRLRAAAGVTPLERKAE